MPEATFKANTADLNGEPAENAKVFIVPGIFGRTIGAIAAHPYRSAAIAVGVVAVVGAVVFRKYLPIGTVKVAGEIALEHGDNVVSAAARFLG